MSERRPPGENEALIRRHVDELNRRKYAALDEVVADEVGLGDRFVRTEYRQIILDRIAAMADYHVTIEELAEQDDGVSVLWSFTGTPRGEPTPVTGRVRSVYGIVDGRIAGVRAVRCLTGRPVVVENGAVL